METETRNSSHSHWPRSHSRQRTTPWMAKDRFLVDPRGQSLAMLVGQPWRGAGRLAVAQTVRPLGVEAHYPVPDARQSDVAKPRRLRARAAVLDHRQG